MKKRTLTDWLLWQESLNVHAIDLGLDRVCIVADRLDFLPPKGAVFTVAGTNGKGSCVALLESLLRAGGRRVGAYTSPHLVKYNERIRLDGQAVTDDELVEAFEAVEAVRLDEPLTYFEFGTLAALYLFNRQGADAWVLEVGMGGRLDAVNAIAADFSLITTVALDHQSWLGDSLEKIAAEKAGIMRGGRYAFYGDRPVPAAIENHAQKIGADLYCIGDAFDYRSRNGEWSWRGGGDHLDGLKRPASCGAAQLRNTSLVLAALQKYDKSLLGPRCVNEALAAGGPPGRFQIVERDHEWIVDVAHNPQAAAVLRDRLARLPAASETTAVIGLLADKQVKEFVAELAGMAERWVVCAVDDPRAAATDELSAALRAAGVENVIDGGTVDTALVRAEKDTVLHGRIVVCGSFRIAGPALEWLGLY